LNIKSERLLTQGVGRTFRQTIIVGSRGKPRGPSTPG